MNLLKDIFGDSPKLAVLIDPDHQQDIRFVQLIDHLAEGLCDVILVGGSTSGSDNIDEVVAQIKSKCDQPLLLFPGNHYQLSSSADGLLLPSVISGRNPDYLIGKHVESAPIIRNCGLPVYPAGYILIDGGQGNATSYITQTTAIPAHLSDIAAHTALAGQLLGLSCIYLESGSGARHPASQEMISKIKQVVSIPLIVGGGIRSASDIHMTIEAGADVVVIGTALEENPQMISILSQAHKECIAA